jgi:hypothetical protein
MVIFTSRPLYPENTLQYQLKWSLRGSKKRSGGYVEEKTLVELRTIQFVVQSLYRIGRPRVTGETYARKEYSKGSVHIREFVVANGQFCLRRDMVQETRARGIKSAVNFLNILGTINLSGYIDHHGVTNKRNFELTL